VVFDIRAACVGLALGGLAAAVVGVACGSGAATAPTTPTSSISVEKYARSCESLADCVAAFAGEVDCCGAGCPNTAIRQTALPAYMADLAASVMVACEGVDGGPMKVCRGGGLIPFPGDGCPQARIACRDGTCVEEVASDGGAD